MCFFFENQIHEQTSTHKHPRTRGPNRPESAPGIPRLKQTTFFIWAHTKTIDILHLGTHQTARTGHLAFLCMKSALFFAFYALSVRPHAIFVRVCVFYAALLLTRTSGHWRLPDRQKKRCVYAALTPTLRIVSDYQVGVRGTNERPESTRVPKVFLRRGC